MKAKLILTIILFALNSNAQESLDFFNNTDKFLKQYVSYGNVDYKAILEHKAELQSLLDQAKTIYIPDSDKDTFKSFWINTYNLLVIHTVIQNYPLKSPLDVKGFFDKKTHQIGGRSITLNDIENNLLRNTFQDPRLHFVLVCGAKGCPPLVSEAYRPSRLEEQLSRQTKLAINGTFIKVNSKKKKVQVSQIMEWYKTDFLLNGNEIEFLNLYLKEPLPATYKLAYFPYDWNLNEL